MSLLTCRWTVTQSLIVMKLTVQQRGHQYPGNRYQSSYRYIASTLGTDTRAATGIATSQYPGYRYQSCYRYIASTLGTDTRAATGMYSINRLASRDTVGISPRYSNFIKLKELLFIQREFPILYGICLIATTLHLSF